MVSKAKLVDIYNRMITIRRFEEKAGAIFARGSCPDSCICMWVRKRWARAYAPR